MHITGRIAAGVAGLGLAVAGALATAAPAGATFYYASAAWGAGNYHASSDFVPDSNTITIGGYGCSGGAATKWYTRLVRTRDGAKISTGTPSWPTDGNWYDQGGKSVSSGTALYLRWYGQNNNESDGYSAPCSRVEATNVF